MFVQCTLLVLGNKWDESNSNVDLNILSPAEKFDIFNLPPVMKRPLKILRMDVDHENACFFTHKVSHVSIYLY